MLTGSTGIDRAPHKFSSRLVVLGRPRCHTHVRCNYTALGGVHHLACLWPDHPVVIDHLRSETCTLSIVSLLLAKIVGAIGLAEQFVFGVLYLLINTHEWIGFGEGETLLVLFASTMGHFSLVRVAWEECLVEQGAYAVFVAILVARESLLLSLGILTRGVSRAHGCLLCR